MAKRRLLISYAHPDDESFGLGGLITKYVQADTDVYLICATNGDAGSMDEEFLKDGRTKKEVRLAELDCAAKKLNFKEIFLLDYHDSGMMGAPENDIPDSLWATWQREPETVTRKVTEVMRQVRPHVVITFNEYGGYGHPDHIAIQQATMKAMEVVNDPAYITDGLAPYQPPKLYYSGIPKFPVQLAIMLSRLKGQNPRALGRNKDIDIVAILENIIAPTTMVNINAYWDAWDDASKCHQSQGGGGSFLGLPKQARRLFFPQQGFTRIFPPVESNGIIETDLFAGVDVREDELTPTP